MKKVTKDQVETEIDSTKYSYDEGLTTCTITLLSGWKSVGVASCASLEWYDRQMGEVVAYEKAIGKLIESLTFYRHYAEWLEKF